jgi:hypothetical protein
MSVLFFFFRPFTQVRIIPIIEEYPILLTPLDNLPDSVGLGLGPSLYLLFSHSEPRTVGQRGPESRLKPVLLFGLRGTRDSARLQQFHLLEPELCVVYCPSLCR